jgi:hypothetical protein
MDASYFDQLTRRVAGVGSRRQALRLLSGGALVVTFARGGDVAARSKKKPKPPCEPEPVAVTCAGRDCGRAKNNCGTKIACGECPRGQRCTKKDRCKGPCQPQTCAQAGVSCGVADDGCGGTLHCGGCSVDQCLTCINGVCKTTCPAGSQCDGQGVCHPCTGDCGGGCTPLTCAVVGCANGPVPDGCGGTLDCSCGGGGVCIRSTCCAAEHVCGDELSGLACCATSEQCCTTGSTSSPSGLAHYCCPDGQVCMGKENPPLAFCQ